MKPKNALSEMEKKAKEIKKLQMICNTILANACYHEKEMERQIQRGEKMGNLTEDEKTIICLAWDKRTLMANNLMSCLKEYLENGNI